MTSSLKQLKTGLRDLFNRLKRGESVESYKRTMQAKENAETGVAIERREEDTIPADVIETEISWKKKALEKSEKAWNMRIKPMDWQTFRADASVAEQKWYLDTLTSKRYTLEELVKRLHELQDIHRRRYRDQERHDVGIAIQKASSTSPLWTTDRLMQALRTEKLSYTLPDKDHHETANEPFTYALGHTANFPEAINRLRLKRDEMMVQRHTIIYWEIHILGDHTKPPAFGDKFLLPAGHTIPCSIAELKQEMQKMRMACEPVQVAFMLWIHRRTGCVESTDYQPFIEELYRNGDYVGMSHQFPNAEGH